MPLKLRKVNETRKRRKHPRAYAKGCFFTYYFNERITKMVYQHMGNYKSFFLSFFVFEKILYCFAIRFLNAIREMRSQFNIPVLSMEPAVKPALGALRDGGKVLVMATPATITQQRYNLLLDRLSCRDKVINMKCGGLVEIVEKGDFDSKDLNDYLEAKLSSLKGQRIDAIVMGCTHYSFISEKIERIAKQYVDGEAKIFDGMYGVVRYLKTTLEQKDLINKDGHGSVELYSSMPGKEEIYRQLIHHEQ